MPTGTSGFSPGPQRHRAPGPAPLPVPRALPANFFEIIVWNGCEAVHNHADLPLLLQTRRRCVKERKPAMATMFSALGIAGLLSAFAWFSVRQTANMSHLLRQFGEA